MPNPQRQPSLGFLIYPVVSKKTHPPAREGIFLYRKSRIRYIAKIYGGVIMNTKIYNVWAPKVIALITSITTSAEQYALVDKWLDNEGATAFRVGQENFFKEHKEEFKNTTSGVSEALFKLTQKQVLSGFNHWFDALITQFPALNTEAVGLNFSDFKVECVHECYNAVFASRMVITCKYAQGKFTDPTLYLLEWERLNEAATDSIASFNEQKNKAPQNYSLMHNSGGTTLQHEEVVPNPRP